MPVPQKVKDLQMKFMDFPYKKYEDCASTPEEFAVLQKEYEKMLGELQDELRITEAEAFDLFIQAEREICDDRGIDPDDLFGDWDDDEDDDDDDDEAEEEDVLDDATKRAIFESYLRDAVERMDDKRRAGLLEATKNAKISNG